MMTYIVSLHEKDPDVDIFDWCKYCCKYQGYHPAEVEIDQFVQKEGYCTFIKEIRFPQCKEPKGLLLKWRRLLSWIRGDSIYIQSVATYVSVSYLNGKLLRCVELNMPLHIMTNISPNFPPESLTLWD